MNKELTPEIYEQMLQYAREALPVNTICRLCGVPTSVFQTWIQIGEQTDREPYCSLVQMLAKEIGEAEREIVSDWKKFTPVDWRAASEFLRRRFPENWENLQRPESSGEISRIEISSSDKETLENAFKLVERLRDAIESQSDSGGSESSSKIPGSSLAERVLLPYLPEISVSETSANNQRSSGGSGEGEYKETENILPAETREVNTGVGAVSFLVFGEEP